MDRVARRPFQVITGLLLAAAAAVTGGHCDQTYGAASQAERILIATLAGAQAFPAPRPKVLPGNKKKSEACLECVPLGHPRGPAAVASASRRRHREELDVHMEEEDDSPWELPEQDSGQEL